MAIKANRLMADTGTDAAPDNAPGLTGVVPTLAELVALRALADGRRPARRGASGMQGHALSNLRGRGMEYAESREYARGDDARHIDWRLTARTGKPHTKLFQAERERLTLVIADTSPALYFGTRVRFKSVQAARAGALAAWTAVRDGDRVAALRGSRLEAPVPPASGPRGALRVLDALARWYAAPPAEDAGFGVALDHASRLLRPGSRLLLLVDPFSVLAIPAARWAGLALHRDVFALLLTDPLELAPPAARLPFRGTGEERVELALDAAGVRQRWRGEFVARADAALALLQGSGVRAMALSCATPSEAWLSLLDQAKGRVR
jgi:uncharacterized protein (DUF58 family)